MSDLQTVSYDKIDPLKDEKPFYVSEKVVQKVQKKGKEIPNLSCSSFCHCYPSSFISYGYDLHWWYLEPN